MRLQFARSWIVLLSLFALGACGGSSETGNSGVDGKPGDAEDAGADRDADGTDDPDANGQDEDAAVSDGGADVGDGSSEDGAVDEDAGPTCKTECAADDCGELVSDGCGGFLKCPTTCPEGQGCGLVRPDKCDFPPSNCTPLSEAEVCAGKCGVVSDGCSSVYTCTSANGGITCGSGQTCKLTAGDPAQNTCVAAPPSCVPQTCAQKGVSCGLAGDGCGGMLDCTAETGGCASGKVCGTGANSGKCVDPPPPSCVSMGLADACAGTCGIVDDGCGNALDCESSPMTACSSGTCGGGGIPGQCGTGTTCTPVDVSVACANKCGTVSDGCAGSYTCSAQNGGLTCNSTAGEECVLGVCTAPVCTPKTYAEACPTVGGHKSCGPQPDGCGSTINCGGCASDEGCGLGGPSLCGPLPTCQPASCTGKCGTMADGCGGVITCNATNGGATCTGSEYCGAVEANRCGTPPITCTPKTCAELGHTCGLATDGCGHGLNCWAGCDPSDLNCTGSCGASSACLSDGSGVQSCVSGGPTCTGSLCNSVPTSCTAQTPTRLTGTVKTPGRQVSGTWYNRLPVPNALVYIPADPSVALPSVFEGVESGNTLSCGRCEDEQLVADGQSVLAAAVTDYRGEFTLEGRIPVGTAFKLVVKIGKWRRVVQVPSGVAQACTTQALAGDYTRLPSTTIDGLSGTHLPKIAISTGQVDEMECVFRAIGFDESEFTLPSGGGRVHMYRANGARMNGATCSGTYGWKKTSCASNNDYGCRADKSGCSWSNADSNLFGAQSALNAYDLVVWDCEGSENFENNTYRTYVENYVNDGGRMFASHFSYTWIENNGSLNASADWYTDGSASSGTGYISLPSGPTARTGANGVKSVLFRNWLDWQGALSGTTAGQLDQPSTPQFTITDPRDRAGANVGAATDEWVYRNSSGPKVQQLSFNTPYAADETAICGRVAYSGFHVANASDNSGSFFPDICSDGDLSAQEKILAFMLFDLATCVSAGDPPQPPSCDPKTQANVCPGTNDACGYIADGCGGVVDCAGCASGFYCDGNTCRPQECTPATCSSLGFNCGTYADGCGGIARNSQGVEGCGDCTGGQLCGLGGAGLCGTVSCTPIPVGTACPTNSCGTVSNGCGGTYDCGTCSGSDVCGGSGANLCGPGSCTAISKATACASKNCGVVSDGCGGSYDCGSCTAPDTCGGGGQANVCGHPQCTPYTKTQACTGKQCGWVSDGCGGAIQCGTCPNGGVCGGGGPNLCGSSCTPTTCNAQAAECGVISDECGGVLNCGSCPTGETCGAAGPNLCGTGTTCTALTCNDAGAACGLIGDGCGGVLDCGKCTVAGETCGGAGMANQCGTGTGGCNKLTCGEQSVECGAASDGCGGLLDCGGCSAGFTCDHGACVALPPILL